MKTKFLLITAVLIMLTALTVVAQDGTDKKPSSENIPFGKKLPPPDLMNIQENSSRQMPPNKVLTQAMKSNDKNAIKKALNDYRQQLVDRRKALAIDFSTNVADAD